MVASPLQTVTFLLALTGIVNALPQQPQGDSSSTNQGRSSKFGALLGSSFGIPGANQNFDYVIIGGGSAGLLVASRLAEDPSKLVAVIEAGGFYEQDNGNHSQIAAYDIGSASLNVSTINPLIDWGFVTTPQAGRDNTQVHYARGKTLGGTSARNFLGFHRATIGSFQQWADDVGDQSYTWDNILVYHEKSLNFSPPDMTLRAANSTPHFDPSVVKGAGPVQVTWPAYGQPLSSWAEPALKAIGVAPQNGFLSGILNGTSYAIGTIRATEQIRESSETAFLQPALNGKSPTPNLIVFHNSMAKKITFDNTKKATGVQVSTDGLTYNLLAKSEVILSAGAFQSPQMLMVSGIGPAATLNSLNIPVIADRPGVGQNLWDHCLFGPSYRVKLATSQLSYPGPLQAAIVEYNANRAGPLTSPGGDFLGWEKIPSDLRSNFTAAAKKDLATFSTDWPEIEYLVTPGIPGGAPLDGTNFATMSVGLNAPLSRGNISISSADSSVAPLINPAWITSDTDAQVAVAGFKRARQVFANMKEILDGEELLPGANVTSDADILAYIRKTITPIYHVSASNKMGKTTDPLAVVDSKANVIGVTGLRVVDSSAFPFLTPGHPLATIYMLAEKISDEIKKSV